MAQSGLSLHRRRLLGVSLVLTLLASMLPLGAVSAAATITQISGSPVVISADTNGNTGTGAYAPAFTGPSINGTVAGDLTAGTVVLTLPPGFEFKTTAPAATAAPSGGGCNGLAASAISYSAADTKATTTLSGGPTTGACTLTFSGLRVRPIAGLPLASGNITNTGTSGPGGTSSYGTLMEVAGAAAQLAFASYPAATGPAILTPQPSVAVRDQFGNVVTTDARTINLTINNAGLGNPAGTFSCFGQAFGTQPSIAAVNGTATFSGCTQATVANGYSLTANDGPGGLADITGVAFAITSGLASKLAICWSPTVPCNTVPPTPNFGGSLFAVQPTVFVQDSLGNLVPTDNTTQVTIAVAPGTPLAGGPGALGCTNTTATAVGGKATFAGCRIDKVGAGYRINATSIPALTSAQSNSFDVVTGPPVKVAFLTQPASASAGSPFMPAVSVAIQDAGGNTVMTGVSANFILSIGTNPASGVLSCLGGNTVASVNGVATWVNCSINAQGTGYTLIATPIGVLPAVALGIAQSTPFNVLAPLAAISVVPSFSVITWGFDVLLSIHFAVNGANKPFQLQVSRDTVTWTTIANLVTNAAGDASFLYGPSDNRYYRALFAGTPDLQPGTSPVVRVVVRQTNQPRPLPGGEETIDVGTTITLSSTIRPNRPELPQAHANFVVYQLVGGVWTKTLDRIVGVDRATGKASLTITFNAVGRFYVRSQAIPTPFNANSGWSPVLRYNVV